VTERNDPCPCGSGRKYKKCCLEKEAASRATTPEGSSGSGVDERNIPKIVELFDRFAAQAFELAHNRVIPPDCVEGIQALSRRSPESFEYLMSVVGEIAVAQLARDGWGRKLASRLSPPQERYLQEMATQSLRPWTVLEVFPGEGMVLQDIETGVTVRVRERTGSRELVAQERCAARVIHDFSEPSLSHIFRITDAMWERLRSPRRNVVDMLAKTPEEALEIGLVQEFVRAFATVERPKRVVDMASGGEIAFVRDRFAVTDSTALAGWLRSSPELDSHPKEPDSFIRFEELPGGVRRALAHLEWMEVRGKWVLEIHSKSREAANANRTWLKENAGAWLRFTSRKIEEPDLDPDHEEGEGEIGLPVELADVMSPDFMEKMYRTHLYHDWADAKIPALQNQTPRQCARTERGEAAVRDLVQSYQAQENRMAKSQKRAPVDLSWLLEDAGIRKTR